MVVRPCGLLVLRIEGEQKLQNELDKEHVYQTFPQLKKVWNYSTKLFVLLYV